MKQITIILWNVGVGLQGNENRKNNMDYILEKNTATNENKKVYSDHNSILINFDFDTPNEERPKKIITKKGYKRYRTIIKEGNVSKLLKKGDLQESYNKKMVYKNRNFHKNCIIKTCKKFAKD